MFKLFKFKASMTKRLLIPMIIVLLFQAILFTGSIILGGIIEHLDENSFNIFSSQVNSRRNYLQNEMLQRWSNIEDCVLTVNSKAEKILKENNININELSENPKVADSIINDTVEDLISMMRKNFVTGAFIILNTDNSNSDVISNQGIYIRDLDPLSNSKNFSDLLAERGSSIIVKKMGIPLNSQWQSKFEFDRTNEALNKDFFFKPFDTSLKYPNLTYKDLGYWSKPFRLSQNDIEVISYSVPLKNQYNQTYGVLGIDLTLDYIISMLPYDELNSDKRGSYLLGICDNSEMEFTNVVSNGNTIDKIIGESNSVNFVKKEVYNDIYKINSLSSQKNTSFGCIKYFKLYNRNTPFENEKWALIGLIEKNELLKFSENVTFSIAIALIFSIIVGIVGISLAGISFTMPITNLVDKVKKSNPETPIKLEKINISEIDELSSAIEILNTNVINFSSKLSQIIHLLNMSIGAFEYDKSSDNVFCTDTFFDVLDGFSQFSGSKYIKKDLFISKITILIDKIEPNLNKTCKININGKDKWIRIKTLDNNGKILGVVVDVTEETLEKLKIEYDRDHDSMTKLLNRRAFNNILKEIFSNNKDKLKTAAFLMCDLDSLKYTNDTYGHEFGDKYINTAASILNMFTDYNGIVARMSGDEFYVFIYGYDNKEEIRKIIYKINSIFHTTSVELPDGKKLKIKASAGIAWYPENSTDYEKLMKFADFAMYEVKNSTKNNIKEFNKEIYEKSLYLLQCKEDFMQLILERLVDYAFQAIVDVKTGEVYAYEALMRPKIESLKSPSDVVNLAHMQSKLYDVEKLTWFTVLEAYINQIDKFENKKIFINSLPNQILSDFDLMMLERSYGKYLQNVVIEIIECDQVKDTSIEKKKQTVTKWGGKIALDDFGSGYSNDTALLNLKPDLVKIDIEIIHGIDSDKDRQKLFQNIVSYSHERNIKIVAEGVETRKEFETVILFGADYIQGHYLSRPTLDVEPLKNEIVDEIIDFNQKTNQNIKTY